MASSPGKVQTQQTFTLKGVTQPKVQSPVTTARKCICVLKETKNNEFSFCVDNLEVTFTNEEK